MTFFPKIINLYFHQIKPSDFERIINWLLKHNYHFISTDDLMDWYNGKNFGGKRLCHISFDDGKKSNMELVPLLENFHIPITVFVTTDALYSGNFWFEYVRERYGHFEGFKDYPYDKFLSELAMLKNEIKDLPRTALTVDDLVKLSKNKQVTIGSHTVTHPILTSVPDSVLEEELKESKNELIKLLKVKIESFSYPNGSLNTREVEKARLYYKCAFTTKNKYPSRDDDIMLIPRIALSGDYRRNILKIFRIWQPLKKLFNLISFR